jgi:hypothetical protein
MDRRQFLSRMSALSVAGVGFGFEDRALLAQSGTIAGNDSAGTVSAVSGAMPCGKIGPLTVSRLIGGGNLTSGFAHSRDLLYVSSLLRQYFTDEKVFETWRLCEQAGINAMILRVDDQVIRLVKEYRRRFVGKFQWIAQCKLTDGNIGQDIDLARDNGAVAAYLHGGVCDSLVESNRLDLIGKGVEYIKSKGLIAGIAGHSVNVPIACESAGIGGDFYMKTLNGKNYWTAGIMPRNDSVWEETPEITIDFMKTVTKPWIAYKVLGAGAIGPEDGFRYALQNGADFLCVGMFDFQVAEDADIARRLLSSPLNRQRPWRS